MIQNTTKPRGRPRNFDEMEAVEKATQVFWSKGYDGVTIDDLVAGMGVGRPSLYAVFGDKRTLFLRALKAYAEKKGARAAKALLSPQNLRDSLVSFIRYAPYLGYGVNLTAPGIQSSIDRDLTVLQDLGARWIRTDYGNPFRVHATINNPGPTGKSDAEMYSLVQPAIHSMLAARQCPSGSTTVPCLQTFSAALHARQITITTVMFTIPDNYKLESTPTSFTIDPSHIVDLAQFYVAYLRSLDADGVLPDSVETLNEPNGTWGTYFSPAQYEQFLTLLRQGLDTYHLSVGLLGAGVSVAPGIVTPYLQPFLDAGLATNFVGFSAHQYFVPYNSSTDPTRTIFNSVSFLQESDLAGAIAIATDAGVPFVATEFGGKFAAKDLTADPALTLKGALDLMRLGASQAAIWDMSGDSYALIVVNPDGGAPFRQPVYFSLASLVPNIPPRALALDSTTTAGTAGGVDGGLDLLAAPGVAAFQSNNAVTVGVANPSNQFVWIALDLRSVGALTFTDAYSFQPQGVAQSSMAVSTEGCPISVGLPPSSGVVLKATRTSP